MGYFCKLPESGGDNLAGKLKKIGANIFFEANRITSFTVPDSVEYLDEHMLSGADNLKTLIGL